MRRILPSFLTYSKDSLDGIDFSEHERSNAMAIVKMIEYEDAIPAVRQVYDDIMRTRKIDWINNFWKVLAVQPELLQRTWDGVKEVMAPGAIDPLTKEMIYVAVSVTNGCKYCVNSHTAAARKKGMSDEMLSELMAIVGMANQTNSLANGFQIEVDQAFRDGGRDS
jgi:AhpD family alkylhydroperoxidase